MYHVHFYFSRFKQYVRLRNVQKEVIHGKSLLISSNGNNNEKKWTKQKIVGMKIHRSKATTKQSKTARRKYNGSWPLYLFCLSNH